MKKIPWQPAVDFFPPRRHWRNPGVFQDVSEDVKTLLHWLRNLKTPVGKAAFCLRETYQGSFWGDR